MERGGAAGAVHATLLYVIRGGELLLIHKKRGLGEGKLNGVGGKLDPGETPREAALREFEEEVRARPVDPVKLGEVAFEVVEGPCLHIHVFRSGGVEGPPCETAEARPVWVPLDRLPWDRMWEDDRYWLPLLIEGHRFRARARFEGEALIDIEVQRL